MNKYIITQETCFGGKELDSLLAFNNDRGQGEFFLLNRPNSASVGLLYLLFPHTRNTLLQPLVYKTPYPSSSAEMSPPQEAPL